MSTQLPTPTDVTDTRRRGGSFDVWIGRSKCRLEDHRLTFVGDGTIAPFILGEQYKIVPSAAEAVGEIVMENLDRGGRFTVYAEDMERLLEMEAFHIHGWR
jgi:hypothetical protein